MKNNKKLVENFELDEAATQLLNALEKENSRVKDFLMKSYQGLPVSPEMKEEAYNYFLNNSVILTAMTTSPGSSIFTEFLYDRVSSSSSIDNYVLQCKNGRAVHARLVAIEKELPKIIEEYRSKNDNVLIGNLGSGPGRDIINVFSTHYRNVSNLKAVSIDKDVNAIRRGRIMAKVQKVDHLIDFCEGNFFKYDSPDKFDILMLIGVLCPLDAETCVDILKTAKRFLKKGGCLIASNVTKKMEKEDPFAYFIMKWLANWGLVFKDEEELRKIYEKAGYAWKGAFRDSYGFHLMGIGAPIS